MATARRSSAAPVPAAPPPPPRRRRPSRPTSTPRPSLIEAIGTCILSRYVLDRAPYGVA
jgi:hypothetical protein